MGTVESLVFDLTKGQGGLLRGGLHGHTLRNGVHERTRCQLCEQIKLLALEVHDRCCQTSGQCHSRERLMAAFAEGEA